MLPEVRARGGGLMAEMHICDRCGKISDADRREMAATMRAISVSGLRTLTLGEMLNSILTRGAPRPTTEMAILASLADLIDRPTCRNLSPKPADVLLCSECGEHVDIAYVETCDEYHAKYCPNCGAEVAE